MHLLQPQKRPILLTPTHTPYLQSRKIELLFKKKQYPQTHDKFQDPYP